MRRANFPWARSPFLDEETEAQTRDEVCPSGWQAVEMGFWAGLSRACHPTHLSTALGYSFYNLQAIRTKTSQMKKRKKKYLPERQLKIQRPLP